MWAKAPFSPSERGLNAFLFRLTYQGLWKSDGLPPAPLFSARGGVYHRLHHMLGRKGQENPASMTRSI